MCLYPSHANSRNGAYILAISFLGKMETKVKAENRALGPQILEWPRGPLEEPQEKPACSPGKKYPQRLRGKDRPRAQPSATCHVSILPLSLHPVCTGWVLGLCACLPRTQGPAAGTHRTAQHSGWWRAAQEGERGFPWRRHLGWCALVCERTQRAERGKKE